MSNYYTNRDNKQGYSYDNTCKEDSRKISKDLSGLKEYCSLNDRKFQQELVDIATLEATKKYGDNIDYNSLSEDKRESFLFEKIRNIYFQRMGISPHYEFIGSNEPVSLIEEDLDNDTDEDLEPIKQGKEKKIWSEIWQGNYSKSNIQWLDTYYFDTCNDFVVVNRNHKDYVRKIAKASLAMDIAYNDMMNGNAGGDKRYKENKAIFDSLSQSAKLSEKTRGQNDTAGLGSLSEITAWLEQNGFLQKKIVFEDDDISKINKDLRHVLSSLD